MFLERQQARMSGFAARATIGNLVRDGLVLDTNAIDTIFNQFGLYYITARNDFINLVDFRNEHLAQRIGVQISRSHDWKPRIFWDSEKYKDVEQAFGVYDKRYSEMMDFLHQLMRC